MYTWVYNVRNISADEVNRNMRILASRDGEIVPIEGTNQLIITDWMFNLNRIADILKEVDKKPDVSATKLIEQSRALNEKKRIPRVLAKAGKGQRKDEKLSGTHNQIRHRDFLGGTPPHVSPAGMRVFGITTELGREFCPRSNFSAAHNGCA